MTESTEISTKLVIQYDKGSFSYSNIAPGASKEQLHELAEAFNSLQNEPAESIKKVVLTEITESEI